MGLGILFALLALGTGYLGRRSLDRAKRGKATLWWVLTPLLIFFAYAHLTYTGPSDDPMEKMRVELRMEMIARAKDPDSLKFDYNTWEHFSNGVCVRVNGKNSFGAYTGFKRVCLKIDPKTGQKTLTSDNSGL